MLFCLAVNLFGCTRNDGNIGKQFGQWKLVDISRSDGDATPYAGNIFWSFQNTTLEIKEVDSHHNVWQTFANYRIADNTLFISFPDKDYPPRPALGLPRQCELDIIRFTSKEIILLYESESDNIQYTLRKW